MLILLAKYLFLASKNEIWMTTIQQLKTNAREINEEERWGLFLPLNVTVLSYRGNITHILASNAFSAVYNEIEQPIFLFLVT